MLEVEGILRDLVRFNTIKDKENKQILGYIESVLKSLGFQTEIKDKFLIMSNKENAGLGFLGHTDTVDFTEGWKYKKFDLTNIENKIYGLGVCDMKSGIAGFISAISQIDLNKLKKGIKLYFTYDEENSFSGIKEVVKYEKEFPKTIIIGEPTDNKIVVGSKGLLEYRVKFKGIKTHSSTPEKGQNAIMSAISFINELNNFYNLNIKNKLNSNFEIPYTTINIGKIKGGSEINSVPDSCEILMDFRTIDKSSEKSIENEMKVLKAKYDVEIYELNKLSPFYNDINQYTNTCNFITEASFLENSDRIILGAGPITAHEVDEFVTVDSLNKLVEQYKELIEKYCK